MAEPNRNVLLTSGPAMNMTPFRNYVSLAGFGRYSLRSIIAGFILIMLLWLAGSGAVLFALIQYDFWTTGDPAWTTETILSGYAGLTARLASVAILWPGVFIVLRLVHGRHIVTALGVELRIDKSDFWRATFAVLVAETVITIIWLAIGEDFVRTDASLRDWLIALAPLALLIFLQSSGEELFFRGYLMQLLARRFGSPWIWAGVPSLIFTVLHWDSDLTLTVNIWALVAVGAFTASAAFLVVYTGNLGAAFGIHWGNNLLAMLVYSGDRDTDTLALIAFEDVSGADWTFSELFNAIGNELLFTMLTIWLLVHPRSPLRLVVRS